VDGVSSLTVRAGSRPKLKVQAITQPGIDAPFSSGQARGALCLEHGAPSRVGSGPARGRIDRSVGRWCELITPLLALRLSINDQRSGGAHVRASGDARGPSVFEKRQRCVIPPKQPGRTPWGTDRGQTTRAGHFVNTYNKWAARDRGHFRCLHLLAMI